MNCPRIVIAGTESGVGKTSLSVALVRALSLRGLKVQTFKIGPDYLDPSYLAVASDRPCFNLDGWMSDREYVESLFARTTTDADIAVIEGVMGLFDGADPTSIRGSTAEIAIWLESPVLLVTNAHGVGRSLAATVKGFAEFDTRINLVGVVANYCGSKSHSALLELSLSSVGLPRLVAAIPREAFPDFPSRHLGLENASPANLSQKILDQLANAIERHGDVDMILNLARMAPGLPNRAEFSFTPNSLKKVRLGLAFDEAFNFYYSDTLLALQENGCEIVRFSPLNDKFLPDIDDLDGIYIGGGYPEIHAGGLSDNKQMLDQIRSFAARQRPIYAECGGLMYISSGIELCDGEHFPMVGLLPAWTRMLPRCKALGYVEVELRNQTIFGAPGDYLRGHVFHYSELATDPTADSEWNKAYCIKKPSAQSSIPFEGFEGFQNGRILVSYVHLHLASRPNAISNFISSLNNLRK